MRHIENNIIDVTPEKVASTTEESSIVGIKVRIKRWLMRKLCKAAMYACIATAIAAGVEHKGWYPVSDTLKGYAWQGVEYAKGEAISYAMTIPYWPFTQLSEQHEKIAFFQKYAYELEAELGKSTEPVEAIIHDELAKQGMSPELYFAVVARENPRQDPKAYYVNTNGTVDCGIGQVNSTNLKRCGLNIVTCFNPRKNIACSIKILKEEYDNAKRLVRSPNRPSTCTGAVTAKELIVEYTARGYNGGSGFYKSNPTARAMTCQYAQHVRANYLDMTEKGIFGEALPRVARIENYEVEPEAPQVVEAKNSNEWKFW